MEDKVRLNVDISHEQNVVLQKLPWGAKRVIIRNMIDMFIEAYEIDKGVAIGAFMTKKLKIVPREGGK